MGDFFEWREPVGNIVCNPPFAIAEQFVAHALSIARRHVAMLLPVTWLQGDLRSRWLETTPLTPERRPHIRNRLIAD